MIITDRNEKLKIIRRLDEKKLTNDVLRSLFRAMGFKSVIDYQGSIDKGKDLIFYEENKIGERDYIAIQAKAVKIHGRVRERGNASEVLTQAQQAFTNTFVDVYDGKEKRVDKVFIVSSCEIDSSAKESISGTLPAVNIFKSISFIDGDKLVELIDKYMPSIFWDEYDYFNKYFNAMKSEFEKIKDISAIGQKEPIPLEEIYVSLKLSETIRERKIPIEKEGKIFEEKLMKKEVERPVEKEKIIDVDRAVKEHDKLVIVGVPGSGKTTLLKHLALKSCK